ncbi:MAG: tyrosine-type recombinase/integrase [Sphingomonas sp.]
MSLTSAAVKAARPRSCAYKMADDRGLFLFIAPTGLKSFRLKFRLGGKEQLLVLGRFPEISLAEARARRDAARAQLERGEDPRGGTEATLDTFEAVARAWHEHRAPRWSAEHAADVLASLETHVFPVIGALALAAIEAPAVLELVQSIEAAGAFETARRVLQRIGAVFKFARARKLVDANPAEDLADELGAPPPPARQPALLELAPARGLIAAVDTSSASVAVKLASAFLALTAVRWAAVRGARWDEIEGLDGGEPIWRVPAARMKLKKVKKASDAFDHVVTLSPSAVSVLRLARALNPNDALIFPGRGGDRPLGHGALRDLYAALGYAGRHVPHGWRASFSTIMNERFSEHRAAIDRALAHAPDSKVEAAYNRSEQLQRRRWLFDRWGALLTDGEASETPK